MEFQLDEKQSDDILIQVLKQSGLKFRLKSPDEEGGFFYVENGKRKKFTENIFVKRSIKVESQKLITINEICKESDEREVNVEEMSSNLNATYDASHFKDELYELVDFVDLKDNSCYLLKFNLSSQFDDAA